MIAFQNNYSQVEWFGLGHRISVVSPLDILELEGLSQEIKTGITLTGDSAHDTSVIEAVTQANLCQSFDGLKVLHDLALPNYVMSRAFDWPGAPDAAGIEFIEVDPILRHAVGYPMSTPGKTLELAFARAICTLMSGQEQ